MAKLKIIKKNKKNKKNSEERRTDFFCELNEHGILLETLPFISFGQM